MKVYLVGFRGDDTISSRDAKVGSPSRWSVFAQLCAITVEQTKGKERLRGKQPRMSRRRFHFR